MLDIGYSLAEHRTLNTRRLRKTLTMKHLTQHRPLLWLLLAVALAYLPGALCQRGFWVADETRYAGVLREMVSGGHWIVPYLDGSYYPDKPPLYFWGSSLIALVIGRLTPFAALFITWLSAAGWVVVTWRLGQRITGERPALIGALLMIPAVLSLLCAQIVRMDMTMAWLTAWALLLFLRAADPGTRGQFAGFYLLTALAMLTKGPLGLAFTLLPAAGVLMQRRDGKTLRRLLLSPGWLIVIALAGGWLATAWWLGERDYLRNIFGTQLIGRALRSGFHNEPFHFYILALPALLLPWTGLFPRALAGAWSRRRERGWDLLVWWFISGLITISLVRGKLFIYVLPLLPPLFLALGDAVARWTTAPVTTAQQPSRPSRFEYGFGPALLFLCLALLPLVPLAWTWITGVFLLPPEVITTTNATLKLVASLPLLPVGLAALIAGALTMIAVRRGLTLQALWTTGLGVVLVSVWFHLAIAPRADAFLSGQALANAVNRLQQAGKTVVTASVQRGIFAYYTEQHMEEIELDRLPEVMAANPALVVIMTAARYASHPEWQLAAPRVLARHFVADRDYLLVTRAEQ